MPYRPAPRDKEATQWLDDALDPIVALTEDNAGKSEICMYAEDGPPSTSQERLEVFGEAICPCEIGKKYKKCCVIQ